MFVVEVREADEANCHYAMNVGVVACKGTHMHTIWMRGKRASPKERKVCQLCADWLVREELADIACTAFFCMRCVGPLCMFRSRWWWPNISARIMNVIDGSKRVLLSEIVRVRFTSNH